MLHAYDSKICTYVAVIIKQYGGYIIANVIHGKKCSTVNMEQI
jgi:hypothetical protein